MSRFSYPVAATALVTLLAACGDPVAEGDYRGEPLIRIAGRLEGDARTSTIHAPYIGIAWMVFDFFSGEGKGRVVTSVVPVPDATFPGAFHLELFDPPPPEAFVDMFGVRYAIGAIVALDDVDGDRRFEMNPETGEVVGADRFFGSSFWYQLLVYVERVDDADCARALWTNPEAITPKRYQLASMDECRFGYDLLPPETSIRLILFPLEAGLPEVPPNHVEPTCEDEGVDCMANPDDPVCRLFEGTYECQTRSCAAPSAAYDACINEHCLDSLDFEGCIGEFCAAEGAAFSACVSEHCSSSELCAYF